MLPHSELVEKAPVIGAAIQRQVFVCTGKSCSAFDSEATLQAFYTHLAEVGLLYGKRGSWDGSVVVTTCGSIGLCQVGPAVMVYPDGIWYTGVQAADVPEIVTEHLVGNRVVSRLLAKVLPPPASITFSE